MYKGTPPNGPSTLLRSYDSRKEPPPEVNCCIWEAGRATCAIGRAFKPIQIGQSLFHDEGAGKFNPSPQILDEALLNEWPTRDVGVFVSIGTGKRPASTDHQQAEWWEGFGGAFGEFSEARKRLIAKIEACEDTHQYMMREHLGKRGVNPENYFRLNVEVGVGEFGMNEWNRLSDISTNTRMYLSRQQVQGMMVHASSKLAAVHNAKIRWERSGGNGVARPYSWEATAQELDIMQPSEATATELPGVEYYELESVRTQASSLALGPTPSAPPPPPPPPQAPPSSYRVHQYQEFAQQAPDNRISYVSTQDGHGSYASVSPVSNKPGPFSRQSFDRYNYNNNSVDRPAPLHISHHQQRSQSGDAPPVPPKTPIKSPADQNWSQSPRPITSPGSNISPASPPGPVRPLPYPDLDGPPPDVNMAKKPQYGMRF